MWNDIDPHGLLDLYNKKPGRQFLDKSLMGMECRYGGGGGGGGGPTIDDQIRDYENERKKAYEKWEKAESTHTGTKNNLNKLGIIYNRGAERWDVTKEKEDHATIEKSNLLEIRKENAKEKDFWVKWTTRYDDYDHDWNTTLTKPQFKEEGWKESSKNKEGGWHDNRLVGNWSNKKGEGWINLGKNVNPATVARTIQGKLRGIKLDGYRMEHFNHDYFDENYGTGYWANERNIKNSNDDLKLENGKVKADNKYNKKWNKVTNRIDKANTELNNFNEAKNKSYEKIKSVAAGTQGSDFVTRRDILKTEAGKILKDAGLSDSIINELGGKAYEEFKNFYREEKLTKWDTNLAAKIPRMLYSIGLIQVDMQV